MELAKVTSTSGARVRTHTAPSQEKYTFKHYTHDTHWVSVDNVEDAVYFDENDSFAVQWTPAGRIARAARGPVSSVKDVLSRLDYREKQKLAKDSGIKANQSEEELEAELQETVEQLAEQIERQR